MKIYDISQEVFSCAVYPGDPAPTRQVLCDMGRGDRYNLTAFSMCAHNGTHVDAPAHFIKNGQTVESIPLSHVVGTAAVVTHQGVLTAGDAERLVRELRAKNEEGARRILFRAETMVSAEAATVLATSGVLLVGSEEQTVGPQEAPAQVHEILLGAGAVLLEGVRLREVADGFYLLTAAPLCLRGSDGAPCRALLLET